MNDDAEIPPTPTLRSWIVAGVIALLIITFVTVFNRIPAGSSVPDVTAQACTRNLEQIDGAKEQWALENNRQTGDPVTWSDLLGAHLKRMPICPRDGTYAINPIGQNPTCSIGAFHVLPRPPLLVVNTCVTNLTEIQEAKGAWAAKDREKGTPVTWDDLVGPDKYLQKIPTCPDGGTYTINAVGENPTCSKAGTHALPQR
jgi:hypothetical protein